MKQFNFLLSEMDDLSSALNSSKISAVGEFKSLLVQIFPTIQTSAVLVCDK